MRQLPPHKVSNPFARTARGSRGFTLVELLVVIAVIGILSTVLLLQLGTARAKARDAKRIADLNQMRTAIELWFDSQGNAYYPVDLNPTPGLGQYFSSGQVPTAPAGGGNYTYAPNAAANPTKYQLSVGLEGYNQALETDTDIDASAAPWVGGVNGADNSCKGAPNSTNCVYDLGIK